MIFHGLYISNLTSIFYSYAQFWFHHGWFSRQEHNGKRGHVNGFDAQRSRYEVRLEDNHGVIHVRPENLTQQCTVKVPGTHGTYFLNVILRMFQVQMSFLSIVETNDLILQKNLTQF